jgi:hypothetical protein
MAAPIDAKRVMVQTSNETHVGFTYSALIVVKFFQQKLKRKLKHIIKALIFVSHTFFEIVA